MKKNGPSQIEQAMASAAATNKETNMFRTEADQAYKYILEEIQESGNDIVTRNAVTKSSFWLGESSFGSAPLVTLRKTAWKKALLEMEWFLSGESECPEELLDWWGGQLDNNNNLIAGYGCQLRSSGINSKKSFDQVEFLIKEIKEHPNSRRLILTTWNPWDMANITLLNNNKNTPTCCHSTFVQFFVRENMLFMKCFQRSADMLLGIPHNWIQSWAMLVWFAHRTGFEVGGMLWNFGDAHIYQEKSHLQAVTEILAYDILREDLAIDLVYTPSSEEFKAADFKIVGEIPTPITTIRPKLL